MAKSDCPDQFLTSNLNNAVIFGLTSVYVTVLLNEKLGYFARDRSWFVILFKLLLGVTYTGVIRQSVRSRWLHINLVIYLPFLFSTFLWTKTNLSPNKKRQKERGQHPSCFKKLRQYRLSRMAKAKAVFLAKPKAVIPEHVTVRSKNLALSNSQTEHRIRFILPIAKPAILKIVSKSLEGTYLSIIQCIYLTSPPSSISEQRAVRIPHCPSCFSPSSGIWYAVDRWQQLPFTAIVFAKSEHESRPCRIQDDSDTSPATVDFELPYNPLDESQTSLEVSSAIVLNTSRAINNKSQINHWSAN